MIGVFDSGEGGLALISELRKTRPDIDLLFLADRENAPYGTKGEEELLRLVSSDVKRLADSGADKVLMACCTASTVYDLLPREYKALAIPIIAPTANAAALSTKNGKIGVIATERTVYSEAFTKALLPYPEVVEVIAREAQALVKIVESGEGDGNLSAKSRELLQSILHPMRESKIDTLILGCTHFSRLENEISKALSGVKIISSAREGAKELLKYTDRYGTGKTVYL